MVVQIKSARITRFKAEPPITGRIPLAAGNTPPDRWPILNDSWMDALASEGRAPNTLVTYKYGLKSFIEFLEAEDVADLEDVEAGTIRQWQLSIGKKSAATRSGYMTVVRLFYAWLRAENEIATSPFDAGNIKPPKVKEPDRHIISAPGHEKRCTACNRIHSLNELLAACDTFGYLAARERAIVYMLFETGVRADELCSFMIEDTDMRVGTALVRRSKTSLRQVSFGTKTRRELDRYIRGLRAKHASDRQSGPLFVTNSGKPLSPALLHEIIKKVGEEAGISGLHPHALRHSSATMYADQGMDTREMNILFGWSRESKMALKYTRHHAEERALEAQRRFSPL